jgi:HlyD family secretion protein
MNTDIFRKVSLARLASPEQLDQILRVTKPKDWVALGATALLLGVAVVWGYEGRIATKAAGQGVIIRSGGVLSVVSPAAGMLLSINVKVGDKIAANQVIAKVAQPVLVEQIRTTREALDELRGARARMMDMRSQGAKLDVEAIERQIANARQQIEDLKTQAKLVQDQIPVDQELLNKGLVTKQQVIATEQKLVSVNGQIADVKAKIVQLEAQEFSSRAQPEQADADIKAKITDLERQLAAQESQLALSTNVVAQYSGEVLERRLDPGSPVSTGMAIVTIQPDVRQLEALVFLPSDKAKSAQVGQDVQISPTTVKREEYGFIEAKVVFINDYPATPAALMRNFQNEALVNSLTSAGPVTEVRVRLLADAATPSGFKWSSSRGPDIVISSGTICTGEVVTEEQRPVSLVFPYIRKTLGLS